MDDGVPVFDLDVRVVACSSCGAPLEAKAEGGAYTCEYCSTVNHLVRRDPLRFAATTLPESERVAALRLAVGSEKPAPHSDFVVDGVVPSYFRRKAREQWQSLRSEIETTHAFVLKEKLFHLTVALVPSLESKEQRAFLETAIDALDDERYRHLLLCQMARIAARHGEVSAAEAWLALCNPRSCDLESDTAYRYAAAVIGAARGDADRINEQLGFEEGELPFASRYATALRILRIHAKELKGQTEDAGRELLRRIYQVGLEPVRHEIERHLPQTLCASSLAWATAELRAADEEKAAREKAKTEADREKELADLRAQLASSPFSSLRRVITAIVLSAAIALAVGWVRSAASAKPLLDVATLLVFAVALAIVLTVGIRSRRSRRAFIEHRIRVLTDDLG